MLPLRSVWTAAGAGSSLRAAIAASGSRSDHRRLRHRRATRATKSVTARSGSVTAKSELATHVKKKGRLKLAETNMACTSTEDADHISATASMQHTPSA